MKKLLFIATLLISSLAQAEAGKIWLRFDTVGYHWQENHKAHNVNPGIGVLYEVVDDVSLGVRYYRNSLKDTPNYRGETPRLYTAAVMADWRFWHNDLWASHVTYTVAQGYGSADGITLDNLKDFVHLSICRKIGGASSKWEGCVSNAFWKNPSDVGPKIKETTALRFQYRF